MSTYTKPSFSRLGSVQELTLSTITKTGVSGDVIVIAGSAPEPAPGGTVLSY